MFIKTIFLSFLWLPGSSQPNWRLRLVSEQNFSAGVSIYNSFPVLISLPYSFSLHPNLTPGFLTVGEQAEKGGIKEQEGNKGIPFCHAARMSARSRDKSQTCLSAPGPQPCPSPPHASSSPKACFPSSAEEPSLFLSPQRPFPVPLGQLSHPRVKLNALDAIFQYNWEHFERKLD